MFSENSQRKTEYLIKAKQVFSNSINKDYVENALFFSVNVEKNKSAAWSAAFENCSLIFQKGTKGVWKSQWSHPKTSKMRSVEWLAVSTIAHSFYSGGRPVWHQKQGTHYFGMWWRRITAVRNLRSGRKRNKADQLAIKLSGASQENVQHYCSNFHMIVHCKTPKASKENPSI